MLQTLAKWNLKSIDVSKCYVTQAAAVLGLYYGFVIIN